MPIFTLSIRAVLEDIESISIPEESYYTLKLKDSCGDDVRDGVGVSASEKHDLSGSRGSANFVMKWAKDARHEASLSVMQIKGVTRAFTAEDAGKFVPVVAFECRGLEPVDWTPEDTFTVVAKSGFTWTDVDLSSREWVEYDEKGDCPVSIMELEHKFELYRPKK